MATFRIHLSNDPGTNSVTNLITGIGDVRDEFGNEAASDLLDSLVDEIEFVRSYILDQKRNKANSLVVRADAFASEVFDKRIGPNYSFKPTDIRSNATGTAIHP